MAGIGELNEKPLHAALKEFCAAPGDRFEVPVGKYVADIVRDNLLLEIQTGNFASMKTKLTTLLCEHRVHLIYPIALEKWLVKHSGDDGETITRRKSPKRGRVEELFKQMVSFPHLLINPNFSLEVLLIREEEVRRFEGKRRWRKKGWATHERRLIEVVERRRFDTPADWRALLPAELEMNFTAKDLADTMGVRKALSQKIAYCLCKAGVIELTGRRGNAKLYQLTSA